MRLILLAVAGCLNALPLRAQSRDLGSFVLTAGFAAIGGAAGAFGTAHMFRVCSDGTCTRLQKGIGVASLGAPFLGAAAGATVGRALSGGRQHFGRSVVGALVGAAIGAAVLAAADHAAGSRGLTPESPYIIFAMPVGAVTAWAGWR